MNPCPRLKFSKNNLGSSDRRHPQTFIDHHFKVFLAIDMDLSDDMTNLLGVSIAIGNYRAGTIDIRLGFKPTSTKLGFQARA